MNTYNIAYNGVTVLEKIPEDALRKNTEMVKGYLYMSGSMTLKDIEQGIKVTMNI